MTNFDMQQLLLTYFRVEYKRLGLDAAFTAIRSNKQWADRQTTLARTLPLLFQRYFAFYTGGDTNISNGRTYVFNGKYYEPCKWSVIASALFIFLGEPDATGQFPKVWSFDMRPNVIASMYRPMIYNMAICNNELKERWNVFAFKNCIVDFERMKYLYFEKDEKTGEYAGRLDIPDEMRTLKYMDIVFDRRDVFHCPLWMSFLKQTFSDSDEKCKIDLLNMFLGSSLMDRTKHKFEYFLVMQGDGRNGKSLIRDVMQDIFGENDIVDFAIPQIEGASPDKANNRYRISMARFLWLSESHSGEFKNSDMLKRIVSGERYSIYKKFHDSVMATHAPLVLCNSNFRFVKADFSNPKNPNDISLFRRVNILNFRHVVPEDKVDPELREKLKREKAAIFCWIVKGLVMLRKNNYRLPDIDDGVVSKQRLDAEGKVQLENGKSIPGSVFYYFQDKRFQVFPRGEGGIKKFTCHSTDLYANYAAYCDENNLERVSLHIFGRNCREYGFEMSVDRYAGGKKCYTVYSTIYKNMDELLSLVPKLAESAKNRGVNYNEMNDNDFVDGETGIASEDSTIN